MLRKGRACDDPALLHAFDNVLRHHRNDMGKPPMIRASQIPDDVVEAAAKAIYEAWCAFHGVTKTSMPWDEVWGEERQACLAEARASIAAALSAWPGAGRFEDVTGWDVHIELPLLIPLPQDASDDA